MKKLAQLVNAASIIIITVITFAVLQAFVTAKQSRILDKPRGYEPEVITRPTKPWPKSMGAIPTQSKREAMSF